MADSQTATRTRTIGMASVAILLLALAVGFGWREQRGNPPVVPAPGLVASSTPNPTSPAVAPPQPAAPATPLETPAQTGQRPGFDVVRVGAGGTMVLAGRAPAGAEVTVLLGGRPLDHTLADARGAWVMTPAAILPPGPAELTLSAKLPDGRVLEGDAPVVLLIPAPPQAPPPSVAVGATPPGVVSQAVTPVSPAPEASPAAPGPMALLLPQSGPPRLLQRPTGTAPPGRLGLDTVDYDDKGAIRFSGTAPPSAPVRVYVDNKPVGDTSTDAAGHWSLAPGDAVAPGRHEVRVDQLDRGGRVAGRVGLPFMREAMNTADLAAGQVVVQPGQNLWRLARHAYGAGIRYTVIFAANREQIRDVRLIYPGQIFAVPQGDAPAAAPR